MLPVSLRLVHGHVHPLPLPASRRRRRRGELRGEGDDGALPFDLLLLPEKSPIWAARVARVCLPAMGERVWPRWGREVDEDGPATRSA